LSEDTFWEFLRPLFKGRTHSGKYRVKELVTDITGIPDGGVQPIKEKHVRLQNAHDLPRYLLYMIRSSLEPRRSGVGLAPRPQVLPVPAAALLLYINAFDSIIIRPDPRI
jgi:hypothetical protein